MLYKIHCQSCSCTFFLATGSGTPEACVYCGDTDYIICEPMPTSIVDAFVWENCHKIMLEQKAALKKISFEVKSGETLAALLQAFGDKIEVKALVSHPGEDMWRVTVPVDDI